MITIFNQFWIVFVVFTFVNGWRWWKRVQPRIRANPALEDGYRRLYHGYLFWLNVPFVLMGIGILTGQVSSLHEYLQPGRGNTYVLAWWGSYAALLLIGTFWMFAGGGAETLEKHPGVHMVPEWPASRLRLAWIGIVAWTVGIVALFYYQSRGDLTALRGSGTEPAWFWWLFPFLFVGMWVLISVVIAAVGGWRTLAQHYASSDEFDGERFRFRSAAFGATSYSGCLMLGSGPDGLYFSVLFMFRVGHSPLLVPWRDITVQGTRSRLFPMVELTFSKAPGTTVRLSRGLADALIAASGTQVTVRPAG